MALVRLVPTDIRRARIAKKFGANYVWRTLYEARRAGLGPAAAIALIEQESGFRNVYGHDPTGNHVGAGLVTEANYRDYKRKRDRGCKGCGGMQGVGPAQLTWWEYQDKADKLGGAWIPRNNIRVAMELLAPLVKKHGLRKALAIYNGGTTHPNFNYADQVLERRAKWRKLFK